MATTHKMPNKFRNEGSGRYHILHMSRWSRGKKGLEPRARIIAIMFPSVKEEFGKYAVRYQNWDGATWGGGSCNSKPAVFEAFKKKYYEHNASFRKGNISHLPGIVR
jgi:hypothetical protein